MTILSEKWPLVLSAVGIVCTGCYFGFYLSRKASNEKNGLFLSLPILIFVFSLIVRLAFITKTFVPPYFDSVEHYRLIKELTTAFESGNFLTILPGLTPGYYHLGFHFLASLLTFGLRADPIDVILVLGQVALAAIPIPLFFLILHVTKNTAAAFFGSLLAGFGWYMPGFAVNWGKYPAITGLLVLELVLGIAYFIFQKNAHRTIWIGALILGTFISTFIHSRALVVITISFASWFLAGRLRTLSRLARYSSTGVLFAGILVLGILIQKEPLLKLTLEPYLEAGLWITLIILLLGPFAWIRFPREVYFSILFILCVLACLFIPFDQILPGYASQTLLDRPFVEMILYFPLSILGGLGLAGFLQFLGEIKPFPKRIYGYVKNLTAFLFIGLTAILLMGNYDFYPSDCCNFLGYDDTIAFDWLSRNSPPDAHILVPSTEMNVLPSGPSADAVGTDAGIWIPNLTGRPIALMPFNLDFQSEDTVEQLCQQQINYIYVGNTDQSFAAAQLQKKTDWYEMVLLLPNAQLYRLANCPPAD